MRNESCSLLIPNTLLIPARLFNTLGVDLVKRLIEKEMYVWETDFHTIPPVKPDHLNGSDYNL